MQTLTDYFDQFLRERIYLHNIAPKTRIFYETAWKAYVSSPVKSTIRQETFRRLLASGET